MNTMIADFLEDVLLYKGTSKVSFHVRDEKEHHKKKCEKTPIIPSFHFPYNIFPLLNK